METGKRLKFSIIFHKVIRVRFRLRLLYPYLKSLRYALWIEGWIDPVCT